MTDTRKYDKESILSTFEKKGVLENLRAYLRTDLFNKLKEEEIKTKKTEYVAFNNFLFKNESNQLKKTDKYSLSLIQNYLRANSMTYTLSVFLSEYKKIIPDELFLDQELLKIFDISYDKMNGEVSFFNHLIQNKLLNFKNREVQSISVQTERQNQGEISMEEKLNEIDKKYKNINLDSTISYQSYEEKILKFQREMELRFNSDLEREIKRIKETEVSLMRIEENKKYMKKLEEIREEYEKDYKEKLDSLKRRETESMTRICLREKELETSIYDNRQKFLNELQTVKLREDELKRKYENEENNLNIEREKLKLLQKENSALKDSSLKKIKEEIEDFKIRYDREFEREKEELRKSKMNYEENLLKVSLLTEKIKNYEEQIQTFKSDKVKFISDINNLEKTLNVIKKDNEMLREEIKIIADTEKRNANLLSKREMESSHLREENKLLRENIEEHKRRNEERKGEQSVLIQNLKKQLEENIDRLKKSKEDHEYELQKIKNHYKHFYDDEKEITHEKCKELEKKNKSYENQINKLKSFSIKNSSGEMINYFKRSQANSLDIKLNDRLHIFSKLEKEADDLKNELKTSFNLSTKREKEKVNYNHINLVYKDLYEKLYEELKINNRIRNEQPLSETHSNKENNHELVYLNKNSKSLFIDKENCKTTDKNKYETDKKDNKTKQENSKPTNSSSLVKEEQKIDDKQQINNNNFKSSQENENLVSEIKQNNHQDFNIKKTEVPAKKSEKENHILSNEKQNHLIVENNKNSLPSPVIIGGLNTIKSKDSEQESQDFSVANITSSNEWELESNRKEKDTKHNLNTHREENKMGATKEEATNSKPSNNKSGEDIYYQDIKNKFKTSSIKEESEESQNISKNLSTYNNNASNQEKEEKKINSNSESKEINKTSFNKFSNLNYDLDKNEIEEEIKVDNESENYDYDFAEDVDGLEKKNSVDLDALKNTSLGGLKDSNRNLTMNVTKSYLKSQSLDKQIEKFLHSRNSNIEEQIIEGRIA
jgi:hypothetical protein